MTRATDRQRVVERARRLRALADSPNEHEARLALRRANEYIKKYRVTDEELAPPKVKTVRFAGVWDEASAEWRVPIVMDVAKAWNCKPLRAQDKIFFEGESAVEAVAAFRAAVERVIRSERLARAEGWSFDQRPGHPDVLFISGGHPGNFATLFVDKKRASFRGDLSTFDNELRRYTWAFECGPLARGQRLVFSTEPRDIVGEVSGDGDITVVSLSARVAKDSSGAALYVEDDGS